MLLEQELGPQSTLPRVHPELHPQDPSRTVCLQSSEARSPIPKPMPRALTPSTFTLQRRCEPVAGGLHLLEVGADHQQPRPGIAAAEGTQGGQSQGGVGGDVLTAEHGVGSEGRHEVAWVEQRGGVLLDGGAEVVDAAASRVRPTACGCPP